MNKEADVTEPKKTEKNDNKGELIKSLVFAVLLAVTFRSFLYEPFHIPSGSMKSTLLVGDYVFVSKYAYGYSRYSIPFGIPFFEGRIFETKPERGDVVVFKLPTNPGINYIKRLIGLPGDKIQVLDGRLYLNGKIIPKERIEDFIDIDEDGNRKIIPQFIETLPDGTKYQVLDEKAKGELDNTDIYEVPEKHYFMMGDNRDNSVDSRVSSHVGFVPEENLVGPAKTIFFSTSSSLFKFWSWFSGFRPERFIMTIPLEHTNG